MSAEHPNVVDPLPSLPLLSSVVEPNQGSQSDLGTQQYQQQPQQQARLGTVQQRQQHAARHIPGHGAAGTPNPNTTVTDHAGAAGRYAVAGSMAAAAAIAAGGYVLSSSRTPAADSGLALSDAAAAATGHASNSYATGQQQQRFYPQQLPLRFSQLSLQQHQQEYQQQHFWQQQQLGPVPQQQGNVPEQPPTSPPHPHLPQRSSAAQHAGPQLGEVQAPQGHSPQQQNPPEQQCSPTCTDGSGSGEHSGSSSNQSNRLPDSPEGPDIVKVSHRSRISAVAGKIAHDVRDGRLPRVMVVGNPSIASATKAIAQARRYLRPEGMDIAFTPHFRTDDHSRALLELSIVLMPIERGTAADNLAQLDNAGGHEARIASHSRHARVGSGTARQLRERGINVLCSVGNEALANSVMATAHAACFLVDTGRQMVVQPTHVVLRRDNGRGLHSELHSYKLVVMFAN